MSLVIVKTPQVNVDLNTTKWSSVHQPIEIQVQRKDVLVQFKRRITPTNNYFRINGVVPSEVKVGDIGMYVSSTNVTFNFKILSISGNTITIDSTSLDSIQLANYSGGYINFISTYSSYYIETKILSVDSSDSYVEVGISKNKPDNQGKALISINEWLKDNVVYNNTFEYNVLNKKIIGEGYKFNFQFREVKNNIAGSWTNLSSSYIYYWVNSVKQIQEKYGFFMGDYVPTFDATRINKAKFQSVFKKPTYFPGFPFSLNFIYSDNLGKLNVRKHETRKDINGSVLSTSDSLLNMTQRFSANRLMLAGNYTSNVKEIDVVLQCTEDDFNTHSPINNGTYTDGSVFNQWVEKDNVKPEVRGFDTGVII